MKNKIKIKISGTRTETGSPPEKTTDFFVGEYVKKDGAHFITYAEKPDGIFCGAKTLIKAENGAVMLKRFSDTGSDMRFETGKQFCGKYKTQFGALPFELLTDKVVTEFTVFGGKVFLGYTLIIAGAKSKNTLELDFSID